MPEATPTRKKPAGSEPLQRARNQGAQTAACLMGHSELDRRAYRLFLERELDVTIVADSDFKPVEVWKAMRSKPELVLVVADRCDPEIREALQMIPRLSKSIRTLVLGASLNGADLREWGPCLISGYVPKDGGTAELKRAVHTVLRAGSYFGRGIQALINGHDESSDGMAHLTKREIELLPLLARGLTLREAAQTMTVAYKTADGYRTSLMRKLGVRDRVELARFAIRERIVEP